MDDFNLPKKELLDSSSNTTWAPKKYPFRYLFTNLFSCRNGRN
jgi:hypothetical protein